MLQGSLFRSYRDGRTVTKKLTDCGTYYPGTFFEGMIDLAALQLELELCNASFLLETRQSVSSIDVLGDFIAGDLGMTPDPPTAVTDQRCGTGVVTLAQPDAMVPLRWYETAEAVTPIAGTSGTTFITPSISATRSYWVSCFDGPCESERTEVVATVIPNPVATPLSNSPVCVGATLNLTGGPAGMKSYAWTGPNGFNSTLQNPSILMVTTAAGGTYTLTVTNANDCIGTATTMVVVNTNPVATASSNSPQCAGKTLNLTGGPAGMTSYAWTGPNGFTSSVQSPSVSNVTTAAGGTYTLTVTNANGCTGTASTAVVVNALPVCSVDGLSAICTGGSTVYTAAAGMSGYAWEGPGGFSGTTQSVTVSVGGTYTVTITNSNGCQSTCSKTLTVNPLPVCSITGTQAICAGSNSVFAAVGGMSSYAWTGPGGFTGATQSVTVSAGGTYTVTITNSNGCQSTCSRVLTVNPNPVATASSNSPQCAGKTLNLTGGPAGMTSYAWTGPNGFTSSVQSPSISNVTTAAGGTYTLTVTNANGCTGTASTAVVVNALPVCSVDGLSAICAGGSTVYTAAAGMSGYAWEGPGGFSGTTRSVTVSAGGTYTVTITNSNGCQSTCSKTLTVNPLPVCSITGTQEICAGSNSVFAAVGGMSSYAWTGPGGFTGATQSVTVSAGGTYTVTITNSNGCQSTCSRVLTVNPKPTCSVTPATAKICSGSTQIFTVVPAGGTGPYTVAWVGPSAFTSTATSITVGVGGTYTATVTDSKGCSSVGCAGVLTVAPCDFCTYTQGFYGNQKGKACDLTATPKQGADFVKALLLEGPMVIGAGSNKITFEPGDAPLIQAILPGGGGSSVLMGICNPPVFDPDNIDFGCLDDMGLLKDRQHRLNNALLAQTITLGLNLRIGDNRLATIPLESGKWLVTQDKKSCAENSGFVDPVCTNIGSIATPVCTLTVDPFDYYKLDAGVVCYMSKYGYAPTVQGLFNLANDALGGVKTFPAKVKCGNPEVEYTVNLSNIASMVDLINNIFDECKGFVGYWVNPYTCTSCPSEAEICYDPRRAADYAGCLPESFQPEGDFRICTG